MKPCVKKQRNKSTGSPGPNSLHFPKPTAAPIKKRAAVLLFKMPEKEKIKKIFIFFKFTDICKEVAKIDLIYFNHRQGKQKRTFDKEEQI